MSDLINDYTKFNIRNLSNSQIVELAKDVDKIENFKKYNKILKFFTDAGNNSRVHYPKHIDFFRKGATFNQRAMMGGNQVGKTTTANIEMTYHLTGLYPEWWEGRRFYHPIVAWSCGDTHKTVRNIQQKSLLGKYHEIGTGLIPAKLIEKCSPMNQPAGAIDQVLVRHYTDGQFDGFSELTFKAYLQDREGFQGEGVHVIHLDEEPKNPDIYSEVLTRTVAVAGIVMNTFTPLKGMSEIVLRFLPNGAYPPDGVIDEFKFVENITWDDVPLTQLPQKKRNELIAEFMPHELDARTKGIPCIGRGKIYPVPEEQVFIEPFKIPGHWPRMYGMDVGFHCTCALFAAQDPETGCLYIYDEYYSKHGEPATHAQAVRCRGGDWMTGVIDYAGGSFNEGERVGTVKQYQLLGLDVKAANKTVEPGIMACYRGFAEGTLKIFNICVNTMYEYRLYSRDEDGRVVKKNDHAMDTKRYIKMGLQYLKLKPNDEDDDWNTGHHYNRSKSKVTGY